MKYSDDVAVPLAKAFDARVDRNAFLRILKRGLVNERDLDTLATFCPCQLATHIPERELLIDLLFARNMKPSQEDERRRQTLLLLLDLADRRGSLGGVPLEAAFRAACLTGAIDDGSAWLPPEEWRRTQRAWAVYERNDELSIGVLGVFWVALILLDDRGGQSKTAREVGRLVSELADAALKKGAARKLQEAIVAKARSLPPLTSWYDPNHEFLRSSEVRRSAREGDTTGCLIAALDTLLAIAARHTGPDPYREVGIPSDYLRDYPLNLSSFHRNLTQEWKDLTLGQWAGALAVEWGVEAHLSVALRKMHHESQDKFLLYVTDEGIRRRSETDPPLPAFTASRVVQAVQFLVDLGLADWHSPDDVTREGTTFSDWIARISPMGRQVRESLGG